MIAIKQASKKKNVKDAVTGKSISGQLNAIAAKKFGNDSRNNGKFVELALKM